MHLSLGSVKEPYDLSKEPYDLSKEPYNLSKEPYDLSKGSCDLSKEAHILGDLRAKDAPLPRICQRAL